MNRFPVIMHIIVGFIFQDSQTIIKYGIDHSKRKEYVLTQELCIGLH